MTDYQQCTIKAASHKIIFVYIIIVTVVELTESHNDEAMYRHALIITCQTE